MRVAHVGLLTLRYRREIGDLAMRPIRRGTDHGARPHQVHGPQVASVDTGPAQPVTSKTFRSLRFSSESRWNERLGRLLRQKKGPGAVLEGVLAVALLLGLIGLAAHVLWIFAIIVMALGLGFSIANHRRDNIDVVNQQADARDGDSS